MYRLDHRMHQWRRKIFAVGFTVLVICFALISYSLLHLSTKPTENIHNSPPVSQSYMPNSRATIHVDTPAFIMELPSGWQPATVPGLIPPPTYTYKSTSNDAELLNIYMDDPPVNLAVNRVLVVTPKGNMLDYGTVSDNCSAFTLPSKTDPGSGVAHGKWRATDFLCDLGNYERDVVGLASTSGINTVTLVGSKSGTHKLFMTYTDNNINPDYTKLYNIIASFTLK
jgi:hypothetical protein